MDVAKAYRLIGKEPVLVRRGPAGLIELTGEQRIWFLQNTITADLDRVRPGRWIESVFLDLKGKVVSHFRVGVGEEAVWLAVLGGGTEALADWFTRYRFRTKVQIQDRTQDAWTLLTPSADGVLEPGPVFCSADARDGYGPVPYAACQAGEDLLEILRVERGIPLFGVDFDSSVLPQEAGLTRIVSVTKGCYVGQEVMARLHFRGHVNRCLRPVIFDSPVEAGTAVTDEGAQIGVVTSCVVSPSRGPCGIAMLRTSIPAGRLLNAGAAVVTAGPLPEGTKTEATPRRL